MRAEEDLYVEIRYKILYEDEFFLVVGKPAPLPVHSVGRFRKKNLLSLLIRDMGSDPEGLRIVNRLDSETSGLVLVAKSGENDAQQGFIKFGKKENEDRVITFSLPDLDSQPCGLPEDTSL